MEWTTSDSTLNLEGEKASSGAVAFELGGNIDLSDNLKIDFGFRSVSINLATEIAVTNSAKVIATGTGHLFAGLNY